jgi:hypothetical protein
MRPLFALACATLRSRCFPTIAEIRSGEPAIRARFTLSAESVTGACRTPGSRCG